MKHRMTVSASQMEQFRVLLRGTNTTNSVAPNFRPIQEINDRQIFHCQEDVDALAVTKDASTDNNGNGNGDGEGEDIDDINNESSEMEHTWRIIGVTFICLFGISMIIILYLAHIVHVLSKNKDNGPRYSRAKSVEKEDDNDAEANGNGANTTKLNGGDYH